VKLKPEGHRQAKREGDEPEDEFLVFGADLIEQGERISPNC
jgi:hypothetical protein